MTMAEPFELVNLAASLASSSIPTNHESSDDGLDPYEFISQDDVIPSMAKKTSLSPDGTPTPLNSDLYNNASYLAETLSASKLMDSLHSLGSLKLTAGYPTYSNTGSSPLVQLQRENEALQGDIKRLIKNHEKLLLEGSNCAPIRLVIEDVLRQLSENNLQLHELYVSELEYTNGFKTKLQRWDVKRNGVLKRIQLIKSDDNKYGTKLQGLLDSRDEVDREMEALEQRLHSLASKKRMLNAEIGETISVLESKSAKYVSLFRNLEKQGEEAISRYIAQDLSSEQPNYNLLRKVPVNSSFGARNRLSADLKAKETEEFYISPTTSKSMPSDSRSNSTDVRSNSPNAQIGMIPYSIPSDDAPSLSPKLNKLESTAYEKGYNTGAKQVGFVKEGLATYLAKVFSKPELPARSAPALDDELNIITEMVDFEPILHFLVSQSEALEEVLIKTSKLAESYHNFSMKWRDIARYLELQEDKVFDIMSSSRDSDSVLDVLIESFEFLLKQAKDRLTSTTKGDTEEKYFVAFIKNECATVATALTTLLGDSKYKLQLEAMNLPTEEAPPSKNQYLLESRITATENDQSEVIREKILSLLAQKSFKKSTDGFYLLAFNKSVKKE